MPRYRYWLLENQEDEDFGETLHADNSMEAAEFAAENILSDQGPGSTTVELAIRMIGENGFPEGPIQMFEVYVDWSPTYRAAYRGIKDADHKQG